MFFSAITKNKKAKWSQVAFKKLSELEQERYDPEAEGSPVDVLLIGLAVAIYVYIAMILVRMYILAYEYFGWKTIADMLDVLSNQGGGVF